MAAKWCRQVDTHAGGMAACSRWLSVAIPPDKWRESEHPEGDASVVANGYAASIDLSGTPAGVHECNDLSGG